MLTYYNSLKSFLSPLSRNERVLSSVSHVVFIILRHACLPVNALNRVGFQDRVFSNEKIHHNAVIAEKIVFVF